MLILVTGTPGSGKSKVAEKLACRAGTGKRLYIATMEPVDEESIVRISRHREMRMDKGFDTLEYYGVFSDFTPPKGYDTALLECVTNLLANEMFSPGGAGESWRESILGGITRLQRAVETTVVVTNTFSAAHKEYDAATIQYISNMYEINRELAYRADAVADVRHGEPVWIKGDESCAS